MLKLFTTKQRNAFTNLRPGETKLGETIKQIEGLEELRHSEAQFVVMGIKEDIGIRANLGVGGATNCWDYSLKALLNVQSNRFLSGHSICVAGALEFPDLLNEAKTLNNTKPYDLKQLRESTAIIDKSVAQSIESIVSQGKTPIIIGGGHNNAYGNIKGSVKALGKALSVINIDPHSDFRTLEGRHSGNGFSYAHSEKLLNQYGVFGLHQSYNSEDILEQFQKNTQLQYLSFESLLPLNHSERLERLLQFCDSFVGEPIGLEIDLDCLTKFPVSALNPSGFNLNELRSFIRAIASLLPCTYLHLCEGSPERSTSPLEREMLGKAIAYLVTDFVKAQETL